MKALKIIGIALALFVGIGFILPTEVTVERSLNINAPAHVLFDYVNNVERCIQWLPWNELDPNIEITLSENTIGEGAVYSWKGNSDVGIGSMTITKSILNKRVENDLDFGQGGAAKGYWTFEETEDGTLATWGVVCPVDFIPVIGPYFGLFWDSMLGPDFEKGLSNLSALTDGWSPPTVAINKIEIEDPIWMLAVKDTCILAETDDLLALQFEQLADFVQKNGVRVSGASMASYTESPDGRIIVEAAIPVAKKAEGSGDVYGTQFGPTAVVTANHAGAWSTIQATHQAINIWINEQGLTPSGAPWNVYMTTPAMEPDTSRWQTAIFYPVL